MGVLVMNKKLKPLLSIKNEIHSHFWQREELLIIQAKKSCCFQKIYLKTVGILNPQTGLLKFNFQDNIFSETPSP